MYMEAYAAAPKHQSVYGTRVSGPPVGPTSSFMARGAAAAFPERRAELLAEIMRGLEHTNAWCRIVALECARSFPQELLERKNLLINLTQDSDAVAQEVALGALVLNVQQPVFDRLMSPAEVEQVARAVMDDPRNSERVRELAKVVLKLREGG